MSERIERIGGGGILYDDALIGRMDETVFAVRSRGDEIRSSRGLAGRGHTLVISVEGRSCVRRHYYRGGRMRLFSEDAFLYTGEDRTRSFREWRLLAELRRRDLPVPRPVAARYLRRGALYAADLITERLPDVESLAVRLASGLLPADRWRTVGATVARFHDAEVFHADLTAHNIQLANDGRVYILDFDRGRIMANSGAWKTRNLRRLHRSLRKINRQDGAHCDDRDWSDFIAGYSAPPPR
ncbi:MAG: 3-deoxy-D-manno-octulosonic acid kinase [Gammaproteobacteria bacterium]